MNEFFNSITAVPKAQLGHTEAIDHNPRIAFTTIFLDDEILTFNDFSTRKPGDEIPTEDEKLSKIGLIKGIMEFSCKFDDSTHVEHIDTEKQKFIIGSIVENGTQIFVVLALDLGSTEVPNGTDGAKLVYDQRGVASSEYLVKFLYRGLEFFKINHGELLKNKEILPRWWEQYINNLFVKKGLNYLDEGSVSVYNSVKKSSAKKPAGFKENFELKVNTIMEQYAESGLLYMNVICTNMVPIDNHGLVYESVIRNDAFTHEEVHALIRNIQFVEYYSGITHDSIMADNLTLPQIRESVTTESVPESNAFNDFLRDPLTPMIYEPFHATVEVVSSVGNYLPNLRFWEYQQQQESQQASQPETVVGNVHEEEAEHITDGDDGFLTGDTQARHKIIHFRSGDFKLVIYRVKEYLVSFIYLCESDVAKFDDAQLTKLVMEEIYEIYLADIKLSSSSDAFHYLILNPDNYYSSIPLINEENKRQQLQLSQSILNFFNSLNVEVNNESVFKNARNYWFFYHNDKQEHQQILLIKKISKGDNDSDNIGGITGNGKKSYTYGDSSNNDIKRLFKKRVKRGRSGDEASAEIDDVIDNDEEFVSTLGEDVVKFWRYFNRNRGDYR